MTLLSLAASAAVAAMALVATGDVLLAAVLVAMAAADVAAGPAAVLAGLAVLVRWGTASLGGVGADQAVLGIAGAVGPPLAAASAWCAAAALVAVPRRTWVAGVACGVLAALVVAGPTDTAGWWVRVVATAAAVALALAVDRVVPRRGAVALSLVAGAAALALAVLA